MLAQLLVIDHISEEAEDWTTVLAVRAAEKARKE